MITFNLNQILTEILLLVLIVLVVFLIVLVKNAISAVKKADAILEDGVNAVDNVKGKVNDVKRFLERNKLTTLADSGMQLCKILIKRAKDRRG